MAVNGRNSQIDCSGGQCGRRLATVGNPVTLGQSPAAAAAARAVGHNWSTTGSTGRGSDLAIMIRRRPRRPVMGLPARGGPGLGASGAAQTNRCSWIISSHEKQAAIKPKASRYREFYINESQ